MTRIHAVLGYWSGSAVAIGAALLVAGAAHAQAMAAREPAEDAAGADEEILVTARKRSESAIKVPDTITVFTAQTIEDARIRGIGDFIAQTPAFEIKQGQGNGFFQMSVRGITQTNGGEAPVTMVVDGVTLPYPITFSKPMFDISQIEVLKGPQGSLYGQNAIGGAILVTTKPASNDFEGRITAGVSTHSGYNAIASLSGPLVKDKILFRISGYVDGDGGDKRYAFLSGRRVDRYSRQSGRAELTVNLADNLSMTLGADAGRSNDPGRPLVPKSLSAGTALPAALVNAFIQLGEPSQDVRQASKLSYWDVTSNIKYEADFATISLVSAYQFTKETHITDLDVSHLPFVYVDQQNRINAFTQELRFSSKGDGALHWVAGAYMAKIRREYNNNPVFVNINFPGNLSPAGANYQPASRNLQTQHLDAYAVFGQLEYDVTPELQLTAGARYDYDPRRNKVERLTGAGAPAGPTINQKKTFKQFQPKASIRYSLTPDANFYLTAAKGFRPGGFNDGSNANVAQSFPSETTTAFEAGAKFALLDRRLFVNIAAYTTDYQNQQLSIIRIADGGASQSVFNVDKTRIKGLEIEVRARPIDDFELTGGFSYIDGKIKKFGTSLNATDIDPSSYVGNTIPLTTKTTFNGTAQYTLPLSESLSFVLRGEVEHKGSMYWYADNVHKRDPYTLINLSATLRAETWDLKAYANNVTGKIYDVIYFDNRFIGAPGGFNFAFISRDTRVGLEATIRF